MHHLASSKSNQFHSPTKHFDSTTPGFFMIHLFYGRHLSMRQSQVRHEIQIFSRIMFIVPNEVQLPRNFLMIFSGLKEDLETSEGVQEPHEGPTTQHGTP